MDSHCIVYCTCPSFEVAESLSHLLMDKELAACVNIIPGITSIFTWEGKRESATEVLLFIKTTTNAYKELETALVEAHPYDCPEIIGVPIKHGLQGYLQWIENSVLTNKAII